MVEQRGSGEIAHVEFEPGVVTKVAAWKLDAVSCGSMKIGSPQVSLAALSDLHRLLIACESRLLSANGNTGTQEAHNGIVGSTGPSNAACSETEIASPDSTTPARPRSRRRRPSGDDGDAAPSGNQVAGSTAAGSQRRREKGGRR